MKKSILYYYIPYVVLGIFLVVFPLLVTPSVFNSYEFPKYLFLLIFIPFFFISTIFIYKSHFLKLFSSSPITFILLFSYTGVAGLADFLGINSSNSLLGSPLRYQGFIFLLLMMLLFITIRILFLKEKSICVYTLIICSICSTVSIISYLFYQFLATIFSQMPIQTYQGRFFGTFGNPNFLGGYLVMLFPFLLSPLPYKKILVIQIINTLRVISIIFFLPMLLLTQSISACIAFLSIVIIYFVYIVRKKVKVRSILLGILLLTVLTILSLIATPTFSSKNNSLLKNSQVYCMYLIPKNQIGLVVRSIVEKFPFILRRISFCEDRIYIWTEGITNIPKHFLLGYGQENFSHLLPPESSKESRHVLVDNAHNIFLETFVSSGFIGFSLFIFLLIFIVKNASFYIRLSLLAFLICAQFNPLSLPQLTLFWILAALYKKGKHIV